MNGEIAARYFDGVSARAHSVRLTVSADELIIAGDGVERRVPLAKLRVSEPLQHAPRIVTLPDESFCEIADSAAFADVLAASGHRDSWIVRMQTHWRGALLALVGLIAFLLVGYRWVLPVVADHAAREVPLSWERRLGREAIDVLEKRVFSATSLPEERRRALTEQFDRIAPPDGREYEVRFRASKIGPNALALPGGVIYVTDDLVKLAPDDDAVLGVLAHELGHIQHRHLLRRLFASAAVGATTAVLFGDFSTILAATPALLVELDYSRDMEREADAFAGDLLRANGISTASLATLLELMQAAHDKKRGPGDWPAYLLTHPPTPERTEALRKRSQ